MEPNPIFKPTEKYNEVVTNALQTIHANDIENQLPEGDTTDGNCVFCGILTTTQVRDRVQDALVLREDKDDPVTVIRVKYGRLMVETLNRGNSRHASMALTALEEAMTWDLKNYFKNKS